MKGSSALDMAAWWLVIIGGLNWLVQGITKRDLVSRIFGDDKTITRAIFIVVGVAAVWALVMGMTKKES